MDSKQLYSKFLTTENGTFYTNKYICKLICDDGSEFIVENSKEFHKSIIDDIEQKRIERLYSSEITMSYFGRIVSDVLWRAVSKKNLIICRQNGNITDLKIWFK